MARSFRFALAALALFLVFPQAIQAKAVLIFIPFETGGAKSLPWDGAGWEASRADYDLSRLTGDTLALLGPDVPVLAHMETLRRATVYAVKDQCIARELLSALLARAQQAEAMGQPDALARFDAGYLIEAYKQGNYLFKQGNPAKELDGISMVNKAIGLRGGDPEMEFAAGLMDWQNKEHFQKAVAGAREASLLAKNLLKFLGGRGKTIAELRASVEIAK